MLNGSAAALIGFYILAVLWADQDDELFAAIKRDAGFFRWAGGLMMLYYLYKFAGGKAGELIQQITLIALVALFLNKGAKPFEDFAALLSGKNDKGRGASGAW